MVEVRRFHSNFLFVIPLTQGVLLVIILDICKNAAFLAKQANNLSLTTPTTLGNGQIIQKPKDTPYLVVQYVYAAWLIAMILKAIIGFRANLKFNLRWMSKYNILLGIDTGFEFIHTTLGVIFEDMSQMDEAETIRHYCVGFLIWVRMEMPDLSTTRQDPLWRLMLPCFGSTTRNDASDAEVAGPTNEDSGIGGAESPSRPQSAERSSAPSLAADPERIQPAESETQVSTDVTDTRVARSPNSNHNDIQVVVQR
ncbi:hypothetical protein BGX31_006610 [Mortierella sp. GBA43]|nr:hypothetical protein BGX31_006610 [Mortierella sp. GBA43]